MTEPRPCTSCGRIIEADDETSENDVQCENCRKTMPRALQGERVPLSRREKLAATLNGTPFHMPRITRP